MLIYYYNEKCHIWHFDKVNLTLGHFNRPGPEVAYLSSDNDQDETIGTTLQNRKSQMPTTALSTSLQVALVPQAILRRRPLSRKIGTTHWQSWALSVFLNFFTNKNGFFAFCIKLI